MVERRHLVRGRKVPGARPGWDGAYSPCLSYLDAMPEHLYPDLLSTMTFCFMTRPP